MPRRRFEHLIVELSVAAGSTVPRYPLWILLGEQFGSPEHLPRAAAVAFCDLHLDDFLSEQHLSISPPAKRRLRRAISRFDARQATPYEWMEKMNLAAD